MLKMKAINNAYLKILKMKALNNAYLKILKMKALNNAYRKMLKMKAINNAYRKMLKMKVLNNVYLKMLKLRALNNAYLKILKVKALNNVYLMFSEGQQQDSDGNRIAQPLYGNKTAPVPMCGPWTMCILVMAVHGYVLGMVTVLKEDVCKFLYMSVVMTPTSKKEGDIAFRLSGRPSVSHAFWCMLYLINRTC